MQISNSIHYSTDPYLLSEQKYKSEHKQESKPENLKNDVSISEAKLEEKLYNKSINAMKPSQDGAMNKNRASNNFQKAIISYNEVENSLTTQEQFNQVEEMV